MTLWTRDLAAECLMALREHHNSSLFITGDIDEGRPSDLLEISVRDGSRLPSRELILEIHELEGFRVGGAGRWPKDNIPFIMGTFKTMPWFLKWPPISQEELIELRDARTTRETEGR